MLYNIRIVNNVTKVVMEQLTKLLFQGLSMLACGSVVSGGLLMPIKPLLALGNNVSFECRNISGTPTTVGVSPQWGNEPKQLIRWYSNVGQDAGYDPPRRCSEVSDRLNLQFAKGGQYLTHGVINGNPVICTTNQEGKGCNDLVFTLDGNQYGWHGQSGAKDPKVVLNQLFSLSDRNFAGIPLHQSSCRVYVDLKAVLRGDTIKAKCFP